MLCLGPFPHSCGYDLWRENYKDSSVISSHMVATSPYLQSLSHCHFVTIPLALMTSPFTQTSLTWQNSSTKFDKSEIWLKSWNCWTLTPSWKILIIENISGYVIQETVKLPIPSDMKQTGEICYSWLKVHKLLQEFSAYPCLKWYKYCPWLMNLSHCYVV